ncbi:dehydrogenase, partial [Oryctes borbonicus]
MFSSYYWYLFYLCFVPIFIKLYWKLSTRWNRSYTCLVGKTAIVTGANTGLGYYTALDFAKRGAKVILACRNKAKAEAACQKIIKETSNKNVFYKLVDMASLESVRNFASEINLVEERLDILVNNAGLGFLEQDYTEDEIQFLLQVNHIAPFLLTHLLIGKLRHSAPSRIINVASIAASRSKLTAGNLHKINEVPEITVSKVLRDSQVYGTTKLCNILFTTELAGKLRGSGVTVNCLHPGVIYTEFFRGLNGILKMAASFVGQLLLLTAEEGAQTQIYLAVSKDVEGISGGLFANC